MYTRVNPIVPKQIKFYIAYLKKSKIQGRRRIHSLGPYVKSP